MLKLRHIFPAMLSGLLMSANALAADCPALQGSWTNPVGGTWSFKGDSGTLTVNSSNFGSRAQQITELNVVSCEGGNLKFVVTRAKMTNTDDPDYTYDKVPPTKESSTPYSINDGELKIGNFTYVKQ